MITKEQLQAMSDFDVNKALAELVGEFETPPHGVPTEVLGDKLFYRDGFGDYCECHPSYCDQPNDIMPLAFEYDIAYLKTYKTAYCKIDGQRHKQQYTDESPLRAIACCLILVLEGEIG